MAGIRAARGKNNYAHILQAKRVTLIVVGIENVTGGQGGNAFLISGGEKTALVDSGMAYCATKLISNVRQVLNRRNLDYIILSHSHYDHVGAVPYLREEWPELKVLGAEYAKNMLGKASVLQTIKVLGVQAAELYGSGKLQEYDAAMLRVDHVINDGDLLDLGSLAIKTIATIGHTKCSLSFLVHDETLFASESTGWMSKTGTIYPAFITSYTEAIRSIEICQTIKPRFIISPHYGLVNDEAASDYWQKCRLAAEKVRDFILLLYKKGCDEEQVLAKYEVMFRDDDNSREQPLNAFRVNARSMIKTVLKESHSPL